MQSLMTQSACGESGDERTVRSGYHRRRSTANCAAIYSLSLSNVRTHFPALVPRVSALSALFLLLFLLMQLQTVAKWFSWTDGGENDGGARWEQSQLADATNRFRW